jgi:ABC-2 type transport system ATP-binding protein
VAEAAPAAGDSPPVLARGLVKRYKEVLAVDHVDLEVRSGDVYGFLGPNGAGKTTTLRMALGLIAPTAGTVELFGRDPMRVGAAALSGVAGFVEAPRFYPYLTGRKNLELLAALDGEGARGRIEQVLETVELSPRAKHRVGGYSHGMRQRLGIAAALLRSPRLLILDEPATGLDPAGMRDMRVLIRRLAGEGITVLLSSHQLPEVQELCDRVAIVNRGRIVYEGQLGDLRAQAGRGYRLHTDDDARAREIAARQPEVEIVVDPQGALRLHGPEPAIGALSVALGQAGVAILSLTPELATLEDLFFRLTEDGAADGAADDAGSLTGASL